MSDMEKNQARAEAVEAASRASTSARRNRLWAAMNRYLGSEERHAASTGDRAERREPEPRDKA